MEGKNAIVTESSCENESCNWPRAAVIFTLFYEKNVVVFLLERYREIDGKVLTAKQNKKVIILQKINLCIFEDCSVLTFFWSDHFVEIKEQKCEFLRTFSFYVAIG